MSMRTSQQQLGKNRGKTTVLGTLTVVLVIMGVKAVQNMAPRHSMANRY